jgi:ATP-dependent Lon protease
MLEGVARAEIVGYVQHRPYRVARVKVLPSRNDDGPPARATLVAAVNRLAQARARLGAEVPQALLDSLGAIESSGHLSDLISFTLLDDFQQKQSMLETLDVPARLTQLTAWLDDQIHQFELWKTLQGKLTNDDVGRN